MEFLIENNSFLSHKIVEEEAILVCLNYKRANVVPKSGPILQQEFNEFARIFEFSLGSKLLLMKFR